MNSIKIMTCGSVDDGKSTLLGRLIYETNNLLEDQSEYLVKLNQRFAKKDVEIDYSLLLDGLIDEKEQGITIDIAFKYFTLGKTQFTLIDSPGHKEYTKNMANAATFADVALILVDSSKGITSQTKKHIDIVNMFPNIQFKIVCINKMDKTNYSKFKFQEIEKNIIQYSKVNNYSIDKIIPISAANGDNVINKSSKLKFYKGDSLYTTLINLNLKQSNLKNGAAIVKFVDNRAGKRTYFLENRDISYKVGDVLKNVYSSEVSAIKKIYHGLQTEDKQKNLQNTSIELNKEISLTKGDALVLEKSKFTISDSFKAKIVWTGNQDLIKSKRYIFKFHAKQEKGFVSKTTLKNTNKNSISIIQIELESKVHFDTVDSNYYFSQLVIIDTEDNSTVGFGYVIQNLDRGSNVIYNKLQNYKLNKSKCLWLTGLPASGKSTIAEALGKELDRLNKVFYIIDGDNIRTTLNKDLGFSQEDRIENNRRVAHLAKILFDAGVIPIVATVSPNKSSRDFARSLFNENDFGLVYINTSLEECIKRDPKKLYSNSSKKIKNITGIHSNYDVPLDADLVLDTENLSVNESVKKLLTFLDF